MSNFTAILEKTDDGWWCARCAEIPGALTQGRNRESAKRNLQDAISCILESNAEHKVSEASREAEYDTVDVSLKRSALIKRAREYASGDGAALKRSAKWQFQGRRFIRYLDSADKNAIVKVFNTIVRDKNPATVYDDGGNAIAMIIPVPRPIRRWKGRPVYEGEDWLFLEAMRATHLLKLRRPRSRKNRKGSESVK